MVRSSPRKSSENAMLVGKSQLDVLANSRHDAARRLGIGLTTLHELINDGQLKVFKLGKKTLIPESELRRFVAEKMAVKQ